MVEAMKHEMLDEIGRMTRLVATATRPAQSGPSIPTD
jgi:hypothetical protein